MFTGVRLQLLLPNTVSLAMLDDHYEKETP